MTSDSGVGNGVAVQSPAAPSSDGERREHGQTNECRSTRDVITR